MKRKNKYFTKPLSYWLKLILSVTALFFTVPAIFYYCYLMGFRILEGSMLGGDSAYHLAWIETLARYFPQIPKWFPFGGTGASIVQGYWVFPYYLVIAGSRLTSLNIAQMVRLLEFLSVPLTCLGIYFYLWVRLKNQLVAAIGAFLFPLSSMAWGWASYAGFFAMQFSIFLYLPAFLFFDLYLEAELVGSHEVVKRRLYLLAFMATMALGILTHGSMMPSLYLGLPLYGMLRSQFNPRKKEKRWQSLLKGLKVVVGLVMLGLLSGAFLLIPQLRYFALQASQQAHAYSAAITPTLPWKGFLGFERLSPYIGSLYYPLFVSILVSIFAVVGTVLGLLKRKFIGALGVMAFFYVAWLSSAKLLATYFPFLSLAIQPTCNRAASIASIYLTIMAAYGMWAVADLPGSWVRLLVRKVKKLRGSINMAALLASSILVVFILVVSFYSFRKWQIFPAQRGDWGIVNRYSGYGTLGMTVPLCRVPGWGDELEEGRSCQEYFPRFYISQGGADLWTQDTKNIAGNLDLGRLTRVSISPWLGGTIFSFAKHAEASLTQMVSGQAHLNLAWQGIHDQTLYLEQGKTAEQVAEMAKWYGLRYAFLPNKSKKGVDLAPRFPESIWTNAVTSRGTVVKELKSFGGIVNVSNKPAVLVVGSEKQQAFIQVFRNAFSGGLSFDQAILVQGSDRIDDYKLEELKQFSVVVLHGYSYRNASKAWEMLRQYVEGGGNLFIETGWQYAAEDWGEGPSKEGQFLPVDLLLPSPVRRTLWGSIGTRWGEVELQSQFGVGLELAKFSPPSWQGEGWGMALAQKGDLQSWAKPVMSLGDKVIIAKGEFGQGKVVWSGMNLFSHATFENNFQEYLLVGNIFDYLLGQREVKTGKVLINWDDPDRVELTLSQIPSETLFIYLADTYSPDWQAYHIKDGQETRLNVYRAGPGFKAVRLAAASVGDKVVFKYSPQKTFIASFGVSFITFLFLLILILDAAFFNRRLEEFIGGGRHLSFGRLSDSVKKRVSSTLGSEEEDY